MSFEFHDARTTTRTLEAGVQLDAYVFPAEILAFVDAVVHFTLCCATLGVHNGPPRVWETWRDELSFPTFVLLLS